MDEQIIELVRRHPILYDTNDPNYLKAKLKDEFWNNIGKELNLKSGIEAKTLWIKLRNFHRDALRRQKKFQKSGAPAVTIKQWKFQKQMQFLVPYMSNRPREGNLEEESEDEDTQQERESVVDPETEIFESEEVISDKRQDYEEIANVNNDVVNEPCTSGTGMQENKGRGFAKRNISVTDDRSITSTPVSKKKKNKNDDMHEIIKQSIIQRQKRAEEGQVERTTQKPLDDDLYHFYMFLYQITKKMPPKFQHFARNNAFHAVAQVEAAYLGLQNPNQQNYEQRPISYTYFNTHTPQPHSSYSSTPLSSPSPSSCSSQQIEHQNYNNPSPCPTTTSYLTLSTPVPSTSNTTTYNLAAIHPLHSATLKPTPLICLLQQHLFNPLIIPVKFEVFLKISESRMLIIILSKR